MLRSRSTSGTLTGAVPVQCGTLNFLSGGTVAHLNSMYSLTYSPPQCLCLSVIKNILPQILACALFLQIL